MARTRHRLPPMARAFAGFVASVALAGLVIQFAVSLEKAGTVAGALWSMLRFFTIISNALVVLIFAAIALGHAWASRPVRLGGITLTMALVGIVYATLLRNTEHLTGAAQLASILLHYVIPPLVALYWLACAPRGRLTLRNPPRWAALPVAYFAYALVRAAQDGRYPYPFIDVSRLGWPQVLGNAAAIAAAFLMAGYALVWLDRRLAR